MDARLSGFSMKFEKNRCGGDEGMRIDQESYQRKKKAKRGFQGFLAGLRALNVLIERNRQGRIEISHQKAVIMKKKL